MGTQEFCVKWNNYQTNLLSVFDQLLQNEALVDVTLACDGHSLKAHKVVLSACSPYFQTLFVENPCQHPIVILKDVNFAELKALIDFMYKGEVHVTHEQLNILLRTAESLKVKGLAEVTGSAINGSGVEIYPHMPVSTIAHPRHASTAELKSMENVQKSLTHPQPPISFLHLPHLPLYPQLPEHQKISVPLSPLPKRRKAKPKKRVAENTFQSDQDSSDAIDMTTSPEMIESGVDLTEAAIKNEQKVCVNERDHDQGQEFREHENETDKEFSEQSSNSVAIGSIEKDDERAINDRDRKMYRGINPGSSSSTPVSLSPARPIPRFPLPLSLNLPLQSLCPSSSPSPTLSAPQASIQDFAVWPASADRRRRAYHCEHCKMIFDSKKVFYKHGCPRERVGFTCEYCGSVFPTHCRYERHKQIHDPERQVYTCHYCPKTMVRMDHLKQHMKSAHGIL